LELETNLMNWAESIARLLPLSIIVRISMSKVRVFARCANELTALLEREVLRLKQNPALENIKTVRQRDVPLNSDLGSKKNEKGGSCSESIGVDL
jgi:hypothetical protein